MKTNQLNATLIIVSFMACILAPNTAVAQEKLNNSTATSLLYLQPSAGLSQYFGDLNKEKYWNQNPKNAAGLVLGYQLSPVLGLRGQFIKTGLYSERPDQNKIFSSRLWDGALNVTLNMTDLFSRYQGKRVFHFYIFSGAGMSSFKSKLVDYTTGSLIIEHTQWQRQFSFPLGGGASFRLNNTLALNLEYGDHTIFGGKKLDFTDNSRRNNDHYSYVSAGLKIELRVKDTDRDGVSDKKDRCPGTFGKIMLKGCPDKDNDGIADLDDACPDAAGDPKLKGCPDTDADGIPDREDSCLYAAGKKELHGCPDKDNDGIADKDDKCPDAAGPKELSGCPDWDGDGITDIEDKCPQVAGKKELSGCPDSDNDGIADNEDACPYAKGPALFKGCPDTDGDGLTDNHDDCPTIAGKPELNGCPDSDNDGIADKDDQCPMAAGPKELAGCPDSDGDGIPDKDDACPSIKGLAQFNGCRDTDGDGIPDNKDKCPKVAGVAANNGCPEEKKGFETVLNKAVYFDPGSSSIIQTFKQFLILDEIIPIMTKNPDAIIIITGYEDGHEAMYRKLNLSEKRVDYVIHYLEKKGLKSPKIKKLYLGKKNPAADNITNEGRALNRRVEIKIIKQTG